MEARAAALELAEFAAVVAARAAPWSLRQVSVLDLVGQIWAREGPTAQIAADPYVKQAYLGVA